MKKAFCILSLFLISCSTNTVQTQALPQTQPETLSEVFDRYRDGIVHIGHKVRPDSIGWLGTGFTVDGRCTFATAKHLFRAKTENLVVRFQVPQDRSKVKTIAARILHMSPSKDVAFLRVNEVNGQPCQSGSLYRFTLAGSDPQPDLAGQEVLVIGHPRLASKAIDIPVLRTGIIASSEIKFSASNASGPSLILDLIGVPGFSGSPVIHRDSGVVIGVIYGPGPTGRRSGFEWAAPISMADYTSALNESK